MDAYATYKNAAGVAFLWIVSLFIPFFLIPEESWQLKNTIAIVVLLFFGLAAIKDTVKGVKRKRKSDVLIFAIIPGFLLLLGSGIVWLAV